MQIIVDRLLMRLMIITNYLMCGLTISCFGLIWGMSLYCLQKTSIAPYITPLNMASVGFILASFAIVRGYNKYPNEDIRDVPRRRGSIYLAFLGCGFLSHASMLLEGAQESDILLTTAFLMPCAASIMWSQYPLSSWSGRFNETTSPNSLWNTLGL